MARDNNLPAGEHLAKIDPRTKTPIIPAVLIGVLAILILVVNIRQPQIFVVITSIGIIMIYIAYLLVTGPMLLARMRGQWRAEDTPEGYFTMGRWGFAVNVRRGDLGRRDGGQPRLAALLDLQRDRAVPLVPQVGRRAVRRGRDDRRLRLLLVRAAPQDGHARGARASPRRRTPRRRRRSPAAPSSRGGRASRRSCAATRRSTRSTSAGVAAVADAAVAESHPRRRARSSTGRSRRPTARTSSGAARSS